MSYARWVALGSILTHLTLMGAKQQQPLVPHEKIEAELKSAEEEFQEAKKMFNPWYTGPLITPSAHIVPPGSANIQPYIFYTNNYGKFDSSGKSHKIPNLNNFNLQAILQVGIVDWMSGVLAVQGVRNTQLGKASTNWGDTSLSLGAVLLSETAYRPALLFGVGETFPTGKFQHLDPHLGGVDATGAGSYQTKFSLNLSKVVWWLTTHPMNFRVSLNYNVPAPCHVSGLSAYGGAKNTHGTVHLGQGFQGDIGYEYSFTQKWVLALDIVYTYNAKTTFSGHPGTTAPGVPAVVGGPFNDQLSLAPAIEYNMSENFGILGGVWFTVWGRNSLNFYSGVFSVEYTF
jgi:hypothetical protein